MDCCIRLVAVRLLAVGARSSSSSPCYQLSVGRIRRASIKRQTNGVGDRAKHVCVRAQSMNERDFGLGLS